MTRPRPPRGARPHLREVPLEVPLRFAQRVAAELLEQRLRQHQREHRLGDDPHRGHRGHIGPLGLRLRRTTGLQVHGAERRHERRDGLHRDAGHQGLARRHAPFGAARAVRGAREPGHDLVVHLRALAPRGREPQAELDPLHRRDGHEGLGEASVELPVPGDVGAEADRHPERDHLDHAAQRVARRLGRVDAGDDLPLGLGVETAHGAGIGGRIEGNR